MDTHTAKGWGWVEGVCVYVGAEEEALKGGHIGE